MSGAQGKSKGKKEVEAVDDEEEEFSALQAAGHDPERYI